MGRYGKECETCGYIMLCECAKDERDAVVIDPERCSRCKMPWAWCRCHHDDDEDKSSMVCMSCGLSNPEYMYEFDWTQGMCADCLVFLDPEDQDMFFALDEDDRIPTTKTTEPRVPPEPVKALDLIALNDEYLASLRG